MRTAGHREILNNIKHFVKDFTEIANEKKISRNHKSKISKEKNLSFMSSSS